MSLIPFILDLADELQDFQRCFASGCNAMDIDETDFGLYPLHEVATQHHTQQQQHQQPQQLHHHHHYQQQQHLQQQEQLKHSRPRLLSQLYWQPNILHKHRHHPYHPHTGGRLCCNAKEKEGNAIGDKLTAANTLVGLANKRAAYPLVKKNGWVMVSMNVKQFTPDELTVKTVDNCIIIEGRHEDKEDIHGVISRHFIRKYLLPKGYDPNDVVSTLSSDGILTVKAPPPAPPKLRDEGTVRIVDIQQTGPTHSAAKDIMAAGDSESNIEQPKTPIATTSSEKNILSDETQTQIDEPRAVVLMIETENDVELNSSGSSDLVADVSLLEQVEQQERYVKSKDDMDVAESCIAESNGCAGPDIGSDVVKSTATEILLAESANPVAANAEETDLVETDAAIETPTAAVVVAEVVDNGEKAETDVKPKAKDAGADAIAETDADANELSYEMNDNKNGEITIEKIPVAVATTAILPSDIPVTHAKEMCVSKGVVIEATAKATEVDGDNGIIGSDTNGRPGIETLANASEELVAN